MRNQKMMDGAQLLLFSLIFVALFGLSQFASTNAAPSQQGAIPTEPHVRLIGPIQAQDSSTQLWTVAGVQVQVADARMLERVGPAIVGAWVSVDGMANGAGGILASRIKVMPAQRFVKLSGIFWRSGEMAGEITEAIIEGDTADIGGVAIKLSTTTQLKDMPASGDPVIGKLELQNDNSLLAVQIKKLNTTDEEGDESDEDDEESSDADTQLLFSGIVQELPTDGTLIGSWLVSGISVDVAENATIRQRVGPILIGSWVRIAGNGTDNGGVEARKVQAIRTQNVHKLVGVLESLSDEAVVVNGITIARTADTLLQGEPTPGKEVKVRAELVDADADLPAALSAIKITAPTADDGTSQDRRLVGAILSLPANGLNGPWRIADDGVETDVMVNSQTLIDEHKAYAALNASVHIRASVDADGVLTALEITILDGADGTGGIETGGLYIEFVGQIESIPAERTSNAPQEERRLNGAWSIAGHRVQVTDSTEIDGDEGQITPGTLVEVIGYSLPGGSVYARQIRVKELYVDLMEMDEMHLRGEIESRPTEMTSGTWIIDGHLVEVVETTQVDESNGPAVIGAMAKVVGAVQPDGTIVAGLLKIVLANTFDEANLYTKIQGTVEQLPENALRMGRWRLIDRTGTTVDVNVTPHTYLDEEEGPVDIGSQVTVEGVHAIDGSIVAFQIKPVERNDDVAEEIKFYGIVSIGPDDPNGLGTWVIINNVGRLRTVFADEATQFSNGIPTVDGLVRVKGIFQEDGMVLAHEIEFKAENPAYAPAVQFQDEIVSLPESADLMGVWQVGEWTVQVDGSTIFEEQAGGFMPGQSVLIEGIFVDDPNRSSQESGMVKASWIKSIGAAQREWIRIQEPIVHLPDDPNLYGEWQIGEWQVIASHETEFKQYGGDFAEGVTVWVEGWIDVSDPTLSTTEAPPLYAVWIKSIEATEEETAPAPERISIQDPLISMPDTADLLGEWRIGDWIVVVSEETELKRFAGEFEVGKKVWVEGMVEYDNLPMPEEGATTLPVFGRIYADWVKTIEGENTTAEPEWASVKEAIVRLPEHSELLGEWQVGSWTVQVDEETVLNRHAGEFEPEQLVWVEGWFTHPENLPTAQDVGEIRAASITTLDEATIEPGLTAVGFGGTLIAFPLEMLGEWHIGDYVVTATEATDFIEEAGPFVEGAFIKVSGQRDENGLIYASWIKTADAPSSGFEFIDPIINYPEGLVGSWQVGQYLVQATENTQFIQDEREFGNGVFARVEGFLLADGSVEAHLIETIHTPEPNNVRVFGPIQSFPAELVGRWAIGEWSVVATENTQFVQEIGQFDQAVIVKAEGIPQEDGSILADEIKVLELPGPQWMVTKGHLIHLPDNEDRIGEWQIGTRKVMVTQATFLDPEAAAFIDNAFVEVRGILQEDESLLAIWIHTTDAPPPDLTRVTSPIISFPTDLMGEWQIGEWTVIADENTQFDESMGAFAEGVFVEVEGALGDGFSTTENGEPPISRIQSEDGSQILLATSIKAVEPPNTEWIRKVGTLMSYPADTIGVWLIDEHEVHVTEDTQLNEDFSPFAEGTQVEFEAQQDGTGVWRAFWIKTVESQESPEFSLKGLVEHFPEGLIGGWLVHGLLISADEHTQFDESEAPFMVGELVEISGAKLVEGALVAGSIKSINRYITPDWFRLADPIRSLPESGLIGEWQVGDLNVRVTANTQLEEDGWLFVEGTYVAMEGVLEEDGTYHALVIKTVPPPYYEQVTMGGTIIDKAVGDGAAETGNSPNFNGIGEWLIDDTFVVIRAETEFKDINGPFNEGAWVIVEGYLNEEGKILASSIRTSERPNTQWYKIEGEIVELPADLLGIWIIGEISVTVTANTELRGDSAAFVPGAMITTKVMPDGEDNWVALWVEAPEAEMQGKTLYVGPYTETCIGLVPQQCLMVREEPEAEWGFFYDTIIGFEHTPGCTYELLVNEELIENPPADGSSLKVTLIEVVSVTCVPTSSPIALMGTINSMPLERIGIWIVDSVEVVVTEDTQFNEDAGAISMGVQIEISALQLADGTIEAATVTVVVP